jgi:hypothetical protein
MSSLKPAILINPDYATNTIDTEKAGWYQIAPSSSNIALRVAYSNIGLSGEIRLNTTVTPAVFQGNNGSAWVDFNALQGSTGQAGQDFTNAVNFNNLGSNSVVGVSVSLANIFATTYANVAANISNVNIRSLKGGNYTVNSNLTVNSTSLTQNSNVITIQSNPLPYRWDFTGSNNTISYLKNINSGWGETSRWIVKSGDTVNRGQAVRLTKDTTTSNIVITPMTFPLPYTTLAGFSPFTTPFNILGIATETVSGGGSCNVCTKGMTTVKCTSNITANFVRSDSVSSVGLPGIVGKDGFIFYNTQDPLLVNYIKAGYFLESGNGVASNGNYSLFYVDPLVQIV